MALSNFIRFCISSLLGELNLLSCITQHLQHNRIFKMKFILWNAKKQPVEIVRSNDKLPLPKELDQVNCAKVKCLKNVHPFKNISLEKYSSLKTSRPWKIFTPIKYSPLKDIHPWKYSLLKNIYPEKYSLLKNIHLWNIHSWKIFTPEKYSALIMYNIVPFSLSLSLSCHHKMTANIIFWILDPLLLINMAYIGSWKHFVFVFVCVCVSLSFFL